MSALVILLWGSAAFHAQTPAPDPARPQTAADLYQWACATCHGHDGKGAPRSIVGFDTPIPDFSDCRFATPEPDRDWTTVIRLGGPARALSRSMPAFGDALSDENIQTLVSYIRGFCGNRAWPSGQLNLPRPLVTDKAFPEDDAFVTTIATGDPTRIETRFAYEHRLGPRSQYEVVVPFIEHHAPYQWNRGLGDIEIAFKHVLFSRQRLGSLISAGSAITLPTGRESEFLGRRLILFQPVGTFSQRLAENGFLHLQAGIEIPLNSSRSSEVLGRAALGYTFRQGPWGRTWSPIVEWLRTRELSVEDLARWDLLPQMHVSLSRRQHIAAIGGVRVSLNNGHERAVVASVRWDWSQGGPLSGWR